jgi:succinate dehydrogenase/fumarate reductase flavoprotein subunit
MEQSVYLNKYRMEIALRYVNIAKDLVPKLQADDFHELLNCHEAEAAVLSAEMQFKAALMRKESAAGSSVRTIRRLIIRTGLSGLSLKSRVTK